MKKSSIQYTLTIVSLIFIGWLAFYSLTAHALTVWTPQAGIYQKQLSNALTPRTRYVLIQAPKPIPSPTPTTAGLPPECGLKYKCFSPFGVIYDLKQNYATSCPRVFIKKNEVGEYDGTQIINGLPKCE